MNCILISGLVQEVSKSGKHLHLVIVTKNYMNEDVPLKLIVCAEDSSLYEVLQTKPLVGCNAALDIDKNRLRFIVTKLVVIEKENATSC